MDWFTELGWCNLATLALQQAGLPADLVDGKGFALRQEIDPVARWDLESFTFHCLRLLDPATQEAIFVDMKGNVDLEAIAESEALANGWHYYNKSSGVDTPDIKVSIRQAELPQYADPQEQLFYERTLRMFSRRLSEIMAADLGQTSPGSSAPHKSPRL